MAAITYDGRSFMLDGKRFWMVAGEIHYARVHPDQWADRVHAAKLAGLNTIYAPVPWSLHEPMPKQFDFKDQADLRRFVEICGKAGLKVVLNLGPFIDNGYDFGGFPAWLRRAEQKGKNPVEIKLRTANANFLEHASRFITAIAGQIKDLQASASGAGGPIVMLQSETSWACGHDDLAKRYLGELDRFIRESGLNVPVINDNNLWQDVEGQISVWRGSDEMLSVMRQLASVRPDQPRIAVSVPTRTPGVWGADPAPVDASQLQRSLTEILAGGGQFNLAPFHGGTSFGFTAGRSVAGRDVFLTSSSDHGAPLSECGAQGPTYGPVRRLATFANSFQKVLASLEPQYHPVVVDPASLAGASKGKAKAFTVSHIRGSQGGIAFVFAPEDTSGGVATLLLPDGSSLPVDLGTQPVAWCLFDVHIGGRCHLDYATLNAFAAGSTGKDHVFVCFGAAGSVGVVSVNGSPLEVEVPKGKSPLVIEHEGAAIVVCNEDQIDSTFVDGSTVYVGVAGLDAAGQPIQLPGAKSYTLIMPGAEPMVVTGDGKPAGRASKKAMSEWQTAPAEDYFTGTSPRFAAIDGPGALSDLGAPYGYGWYKISLKSSAAKRGKFLLPDAGDRLHLFLDGEPAALAGVGPGAEGFEPTLSFKKGDHELVILADNMGRFTSGRHLAEPKGVISHLWDTEAFKAGKAINETADPINVLEHFEPVNELRIGDTTWPERVTWSFIHRRKAPIIMAIDALPCRAVLVLNDEPIELLDPSGPAFVTFDQETLNRGKNTIQIAVLLEGYVDAESDADEFAQLSKLINQSIRFLEGKTAMTDGAQWGFAKWEPPAPSAFKTPEKLPAKPTGLPTWFRARFNAGDLDAPVFFDTTGLTKGQIMVNGQNLGRYFTGQPSGSAIAGDPLVYLPMPWLRAGEENEILVFDEHGANPGKSRIVIDSTLAPIRHEVRVTDS